MITDDQLYSLAIFLGSIAMLLIVVYHFLEVNAKSSGDPTGEPVLSEERKADVALVGAKR